MCLYLSARVPHPTVFALVEDLWWQGVPGGRPRLLGNVLPHPLPVHLVGGDVTFLVLDLIGRQEAQHVLLLLLDLCAPRGGTERKSSVRQASTHGLLREHKAPPTQPSAISLLKKTLSAFGEKGRRRNAQLLCNQVGGWFAESDGSELRMKLSGEEALPHFFQGPGCKRLKEANHECGPYCSIYILVLIC